MVAPAKDSEIFFGGYESDIPDNEPLNIPEVPTNEPTEDEEGLSRKRWHQVLDISVQDAQHQKQSARHKVLECALKSIDRLVVSQKTKWNGGEHGLEVKHA